MHKLVFTLLLSMGIVQLIAGQAITDVVDPTSATKLQDGFTWVEGALWDKVNTRLLFADTNANKLKFMPSGNPPAQDQTNPFTGVNAQLFDTHGRRIVCEQLGRKLSRWNTDGTYVTLASEYQGLKINSPNDVAIWKDGSIFFSDPPYGVTPDNEELHYYAFWRLRPTGTLEIVTKEFNRPNGICFAPSGNLVYVNDIEAGTIWTFPVDPTTGDWNLAGKAVFTQSAPWPDGMKTDMNGNLYVVGADGLRIYSPTAQLIGQVGGFAGTNLAFGDADFKTIYITAKQEVWKVQGKIAGLPTDGSFGAVQTSSSAATSSSTPTSSTTPSSSTQASSTQASSSTQATSDTPSTSATQTSQNPTSANPSTSNPTSANPTSANPSTAPSTSDPASCEQTTETSSRPTSTSTPASSTQVQQASSSPAFALRPEMLVGILAIVFMACF